MAFENLLSLIENPSFMDRSAPQGSVRNFVTRLTDMISGGPGQQGPEMALPALPSMQAAPMGKKTQEDMRAYTPGDISDPAAADFDPHQKAFLNAISSPESRGRYDVRYTPQGGARFSDFSQHPGVFEKGPEGPSSAAGRYQFTKTTWDDLGGGSFEPVTQDIRGWQLAERDFRAKTGKDLGEELQKNGFTPDVAKALSGTWTSLRSPRAVKEAQAVYEQSIKRYGEQKVAGEVVPLPIAPGPNAGNTNQSADFATGKNAQPNVLRIPMPTLQDWQRRTLEKMNRSDVTPEQDNNFKQLISASPVADQIMELLQSKDRWALDDKTWMRDQDGMAWPQSVEQFFSSQRPEVLQELKRQAGNYRLKTYMLDRLGVDTLDQFGSYDDTPTPSQKERSGGPRNLKQREKQMEREQKEYDNNYDEEIKRYYFSGKGRT